MPIDGSGPLPYIINRILITEPTVNMLAEQGIFLLGDAFDALGREPVPILAGIRNKSGAKKTVKIKPVNGYPTVRVRVFGPIDRRFGFIKPKPPMVLMREVLEEISVTINPNQIHTILHFFWDQRDERTGEMVPGDERYLAVVEFCGEFWVDEEKVGVISEPLRVFGWDIRVGKEPELTISPYPYNGGGVEIPKPPESPEPPRPPSL